MPDAYGNLTSIEDFTTDRPFRFISYLDPDIVLACATDRGPYVHRLSTATTWFNSLDQSVFCTGSYTRLLGAATAEPGHFFLLPAAIDQDPAHPEHVALARAYVQEYPMQLTWWEFETEAEVPVPYVPVAVPVEHIKRGGLSMALDAKPLRERMFTVDFVDGCWFALNTYDRRMVVDIAGGATAEGSPIILFPWNGGDNQRWRAELLPG